MISQQKDMLYDTVRLFRVNLGQSAASPEILAEKSHACRAWFMLNKPA